MAKRGKKKGQLLGINTVGVSGFTLKRMHTTEETGLHTLRANEVIWSACMCSHTWAGPEGAHINKKGLSSFGNENVCIIFYENHNTWGLPSWDHLCKLIHGYPCRCMYPCIQIEKVHSLESIILSRKCEGNVFYTFSDRCPYQGHEN